jgi:hypothetical protein
LTKFNQEKFEEAEGLYRHLLECQERHLGPEHNDTIKTRLVAGAHASQAERAREWTGLSIFPVGATCCKMIVKSFVKSLYFT